jgi:GntR family galactonate operon transcriptional repressor
MTASTNLTGAKAKRGRLPRRSLHREAVESLGPRIVRGEIPEGSALPIESALGEELDVSRTVVREAVKVLAAKGLVSTRPRTGTRVLPRSSWDVLDHDVLRWIVDSGPDKDFFEDLFEVRVIIEPQAAALAAERRTPAEAAKLGQLLEGVEAAGDDPRMHIETDLPLHAAILEASHNELLVRLSSTLGVALAAGRAVTTRVTESMKLSIPLHHEAVTAIIEGQPQRAREAMHTIITHARKDMEIALAEDDAASGSRR